MAESIQQDWRELCVAVTNENDSTKLSSLVQELIEALDEGERSWRHPGIRPCDKPLEKPVRSMNDLASLPHRARV
jgi:hypothetical protein